MAEVTGVAAVVREQVAASEPPAVAVQLPLMPADQLDLIPQDVNRTRALREGPRPPGRPPGARNKSTNDWRDFILARYRSPLVAMAETYSRSVHDLAKELGCTLLEAFRLQQQAASELAPYVHGKMPVEVAIDANGLPMLVLADPAAIAASLAAKGSGAWDPSDLVPIAGTAEISRFSEGAPDQSNADQSNDGPKPASHSHSGPLEPQIEDQRPDPAAGPDQAPTEPGGGA